MANPEHLAILAQGVEAWNEWRKANPGIKPDLSGAELCGIDFTSDSHAQIGRDFEVDFHSASLRKTDFTGATLLGSDLSEADLSGAILMQANVSFANVRKSCLIGANLYKADLHCSNLTLANLSRAHLYGSYLEHADFRGANLREADLRAAILIETSFTDNANLKGCWVHGISVWQIEVDETTAQSDLIITNIHEPKVTVDDLEVAQFIYLLLNRKKVRNVLDTVTSKAVLLLGRFTPERKAILDALADELRKHNLLPIIFDFERSTNRDFTETIKILAGAGAGYPHKSRRCLDLGRDCLIQGSVLKQGNGELDERRIAVNTENVMRGGDPHETYSDLLRRHLEPPGRNHR
ncbi:pentapeptide repeat-containing protein [Halomonas cerina]|uniref:Uncharacterized protein YjbI with pentapeptide repeats n=1 Tax=Halomonas cerina TaxID=447424 RepID=A0A839V5F8_9GAMM|nr:pentapeptide repeat-containing protein [Halomonas cerina]MBB3189228.1 uncharacterized protein YjbI with pentapeptide repeats [Halomonas cerina]